MTDPQPEINPNQQSEATHVAVEMAVFRALMQLLDTLPHGQVRQLHDALSQSKTLSANSDDGDQTQSA